jgi:hypothetical protein
MGISNGESKAERIFEGRIAKNFIDWMKDMKSTNS